MATTSTVPDHGNAIMRMMSDGIAIPDIAALTGRTQTEVETALLGVRPMRGVQLRSRVYDLHSVMEVLGGDTEAAAGQLEEAIKRMRPNQLPAALSKEFWSGQRERLNYLEETKVLWRQDRVQKAIAAVLKVVRQAGTLLVDNVEQQTTLSQRQRDIIQQLSDAMLGDCRDALTEHFKDWDGSQDREDPDPGNEPPGPAIDLGVIGD